METYSNQGGVYSRGHTRHSNIPLTGITGVSMQIGNHPANETNTSSHSHHFDGRGISPVSDEEYDGFKSKFWRVILMPAVVFWCWVVKTFRSANYIEQKALIWILMERVDFWSFNKLSQAVFQEMYGGQCGEFVCWSWGLKLPRWPPIILIKGVVNFFQDAPKRT